LTSYTRVATGLLFALCLTIALIAIGLYVAGKSYDGKIAEQRAALEAAAAEADSIATYMAGPGGTWSTLCYTCHGENAEGMEALKTPALHMQLDWYLVSQLEKFRHDLRGSDPQDTTGAQMRSIAVALQDEALIQGLAEFIPTLDAPPPPPGDGSVENGRELYETTCKACHGDTAEGNEEMFAPALAGQGPWYTIAQIRKFQSGLRGSPTDDIYGALMKGMSIFLKDEASIRDVAAYVASLPAAN